MNRVIVKVPVNVPVGSVVLIGTAAAWADAGRAATPVEANARTPTAVSAHTAARSRSDFIVVVLLRVVVRGRSPSPPGRVSLPALYQFQTGNRARSRARPTAAHVANRGRPVPLANRRRDSLAGNTTPRRCRTGQP